MQPEVAPARPHYNQPPGAYHLGIPKSDPACSWQAGGPEVSTLGSTIEWGGLNITDWNRGLSRVGQMVIGVLLVLPHTNWHRQDHGSPCLFSEIRKKVQNPCLIFMDQIKQENIIFPKLTHADRRIWTNPGRPPLKFSSVHVMDKLARSPQASPC